MCMHIQTFAKVIHEVGIDKRYEQVKTINGGCNKICQGRD